MILTLDIGNTNMKTALFEGPEMKQYWRLSTNRNRTSDEYGMAMMNLLDHHGIRRDQVKGIIDIELAIPAQMKDDVALEVLGRAPIYEYCRSGGMLFDDEGVYNAIKKIMDGGAK